MIKVIVSTTFGLLSATSPLILAGCLGPRGAPPEAFAGADRGRWSRQGATRTPASRQPKLHGPGARARASLGAHGGSAVRRLPSARRRRWPRSGGEASAPEREGSLKSNAHRGSC